MRVHTGIVQNPGGTRTQIVFSCYEYYIVTGSEHMNGFLADLTRWCLGLAAVTALALCTELPSAAAQAPTSSRPKLAVLPLENNSSDAAQNFFAEGMTDEIASALTGVRGLDVVARSSSFQLKPGNRDIKAIGQALNASYLVQGSARLAADRVRFNMRLVQASDGAQLWSGEYDAELPKIFDLEEDIAKKIAAALKVSANPGEALVRQSRRLSGFLARQGRGASARGEGARRCRGAPGAGADARSRFYAGFRDAGLWLRADAAVRALAARRHA